MTEEEWLTSDDLMPLLDWVYVRQRQRRRRLFGCACSRELKEWVDDPQVWKAIAASERYADKEIAKSTMEKWSRTVRDAWMALGHGKKHPKHRITNAVYAALRYSCDVSVMHIGFEFGHTLICDDSPMDVASRGRLKQRFLANLRDIYGNPFQTVTFSKKWRTETAIGIAAKMYDSREFGDLPVLADAVQDAGCDSEPVLAHLRGPGPHVRGCWAVDLVLGRG